MGKKDNDKVVPDVVHLLPREICEMTKWGLRAAHIPSGYSPAAEQMVLDCELFQQRGLAELQTFLSGDVVPAVRVHLVSDTGAVAHIRAQEQNVLVCAPAVFDFAYARVRQNGRFLITAHELTGGFPFLPELAADMAQRGVACVVLWSNDHISGAITAFPDMNGEIIVYTAPHHDPTAAHLLCHSAKLNRELPQDKDCLSHLFTPVAQPVLETSLPNSFSLYCLTEDQYDPLKWMEAFQAQWGEGQTANGRDEQRQTAELYGLTVRGQLWDTVKRYGNQILIEAASG